MNDNLIAFDFSNVVHWRYERHFYCFPALVCRSNLLIPFNLSFTPNKEKQSTRIGTAFLCNYESTNPVIFYSSFLQLC